MQPNHQSRANLILDKLRSLYEELFFPTNMLLRPMNSSESNLYGATNFPNSDPPCIGTFLNVSWVAVLDYFGLKIQAIDDASQVFTIPYRAKSCEELATQLSSTLNDLVSLTSEAQLFDNDFLGKRRFVPENTNTQNISNSKAKGDELQQQNQQ